MNAKKDFSGLGKTACRDQARCHGLSAQLASHAAEESIADQVQDDGMKVKHHQQPYYRSHHADHLVPTIAGCPGAEVICYPLVETG